MKSDVQPLVSVVVPTFSRPEMLLQALASVNEQTYDNLEIIIVDDNGRGTRKQLETENIISDYKIGPGRTLHYIIRENNGGGAQARNTGIEFSHGEYVAFLDDDDRWLPNKIELQVAAMAGSESIGLSYGHCRAILDDGRTIDYRMIINGNALVEQALCGCIAATSQWVARREALINVGCFSDSPSKQDGILLYKLLLAGYEIRCVPIILSFYSCQSHRRISNGSKTLEGERNLAKLVRDSYDRFSLNDRRRIEAATRYRIGRLLWLQGDCLKGGLQLCLSFGLAPFDFINKIIHIRRLGQKG
ncbi:glycosyltransferase family 2 protein [Granulimonas faecalis]|uniref:glycosyltransferase family 2 protein n=1 Tax=Granulimonas faecalis TaxID=2894155 RepID=UPI003513C5F3